MKKKYLVYGGTVISKNDNQQHYLIAQQVAHCYGVNLEECIFIRVPHIEDSYKTWDFFRHQDELRNKEGLIELHPDPSGEYKINEKIK